jgi:LacI family transcriptional regulator
MSKEPHILVLIESSRESGRQIISGIADYARHFGPWRFHWELSGVASIQSSRDFLQSFDGVLCRDVAQIEPLLDAGVPVVTFLYSQHQRAGVGWVSIDDYALGQVAADHFLERGFRHFAFCGLAGAPWSQGRETGFYKAVKNGGYDSVDVFNLQRAGEGVEGLAEWLRSLPRPVAVMAANDEIALEVTRACRAAKLRIPDECAVVGVDNDPVVCGMSFPPLSSVRVQQHQSGYDAAALLDKMMRGASPKSMEVVARAGELVLRESSDVFSVEDDAVCKALRFIHENVDRPIQVDEVAQAAGLYRRGLERRFHKYLGHTILEVCREARASHVAKVLRESRWSLEEIAFQCGFSQPSHLTRFFTSARGETPSAYRKRVRER